MKIKVIAITILASILIMITPAYFIAEVESALSLGASVLGGVSGAGAIAFGYIIYKDLGIGKFISDKQIACAFEFLEELRSIQFQATCFNDNVVEAMLMFQINRHSIVERYFDSDDHKYSLLNILVNPDNYSNRLNGLKEIANSLAMPPSLRSAIEQDFERISPLIMVGIDSGDINYKRHVKLRIFPDTSPGVNPWMKLGEEADVTLQEYFRSLKNLGRITQAWLERNSKLKLN